MRGSGGGLFGNKHVLNMMQGGEGEHDRVRKEASA